MKEKGLNIEEQDHPADFVWVNIKKLCDGNYDGTTDFTQCALINSILDDIDMEIHIQNRSQWKHHFNGMYLRIHQNLTGTSINAQPQVN